MIRTMAHQATARHGWTAVTASAEWYGAVAGHLPCRGTLPPPTGTPSIRALGGTTWVFRVARALDPQ